MVLPAINSHIARRNLIAVTKLSLSLIAIKLQERSTQKKKKILPETTMVVASQPAYTEIYVAEVVCKWFCKVG